MAYRDINEAGARTGRQEATIAKILVIDDDAALRKVMSTILAKARHEVIEATDGIDGVRKFRAENPDIVISDIMMPHRDGIETIQVIRDAGLKTGVIAISGGGVGAGKLYLSVAEGLGADAIVQKPFRAADLIAAVDNLLAKLGEA